MPKPLRILLLLGVITLSVPSAGLAAEVTRYSVMTSNRVIGALSAESTGNRIRLLYSTKDNGRGPSSDEYITLDERGFPSHWRLSSTSFLGAPVQELFDRKGAGGAWSGDADSGQEDKAAGKLYLANTASPWALGLYARLALQTPDHELVTLPAGTIHVEKLDPVTLVGANGTLSGDIFRLSGPWFDPEYVVLRSDGELLAALPDDSSVVVAEGFEGEYEHLLTIRSTYVIQRLRSLQQQLAHHYDTLVEIKNIHVFDAVDGDRGPLTSLCVFRGVITSVVGCESGSPGTVVFDGGGGTVIPGLFDMHTHTASDSGLMDIAAGITSVRDMGNNNEFLLNLMPRIESGELAGPHITPNGFTEGVSPYSSNVGRLVGSLPEALDAIRWYADRGYWQLKIYNSIHGDWVKPMAAEAHRLGMGVTGHLPAFTNADEMIEAGYDEITHINQLMLGWVLSPGEDTRTTLRITALNRLANLDLDSPRVQRTLALMREHHIALDTTIAVQEQLATSQAGRTQPFDVSYAEHLPIAEQRARRVNFELANTDVDRQQYADAIKKMKELIKRLHAQGTVLLPGTDWDGGFTLHRELELYVESGLTPADTLKMDTYGTAVYMRKDQSLGSITRGKAADLVLLAGDPTTNISAVRHPRLVMKGDEIYFPDEIYLALGIRPFENHPSMSVSGGATGTPDPAGAKRGAEGGGPTSHGEVPGAD